MGTTAKIINFVTFWKKEPEPVKEEDPFLPLDMQTCPVPGSTEVEDDEINYEKAVDFLRIKNKQWERNFN